MIDDIKDEPDHDKGDSEGKHEFGFTYDDTGDSTDVRAPNGWTMQHVIDAAYKQLGETARVDDRVEFTSLHGTSIMTAELRSMRVKEFVERRISTDNQFHIVSKAGGAAL
jgi:hypothetical protein